jgi:cytochrome c oxidase subunit 2
MSYMVNRFLAFSAIGSLVLLAGAGCPPKNAATVDTSASVDTETEVNTAPATPPPSIMVADQNVKNQVQIGKTQTSAPAWVVIHAVENGKPGKVIGQLLISAGENQSFGVPVSGNVTAELVAMLHVDKGQAGTFEPSEDSPVLGNDGAPVMVKFKTTTAPVTPEKTTTVPSKPLSQELPPGVNGSHINAPNIPALKPEEPKQPAPQEPTPQPSPAPVPVPEPQPSVKSFTMTAKMFEFVPSTITVNKGDKVKLTITATDVTHGFSIPDFGVSATLEPNQPKTVEFTADKAGTFSFRCSVFCGDGHSGMTGTLIVK